MGLLKPEKNKIVLSGLLLFLSIINVNAETVLITGSNSGIGLEFARQYAARGWHVIATHRRDTIPETLKELSGKFDHVQVERMDVTSREQINSLAEKLKGRPIDLLINNAGIVMLGGFSMGNNSQSLGSLDYEHFDTFMATNVRGPIMISEAFIEHVKASNLKQIVSISSVAGTVSVTPRNGGLYWYGMSKAALNKLMVTLAADLKADGVTVVMFHPGTVKVEKMADFNFPGMIETPVAVGNMIKTIDGLTIADTGKFLHNDGTPHPW